MKQIYFFYIKSLESFSQTLDFILREKTLIPVCDRWPWLVAYFGFVFLMFIEWFGGRNFSTICFSSVAKFRRRHWFYISGACSGTGGWPDIQQSTGVDVQFKIRTPELRCLYESKCPSSVVSRNLVNAVGWLTQDLSRCSSHQLFEKGFSLPTCEWLRETAQLPRDFGWGLLDVLLYLAVLMETRQETVLS